MRLKLLLLAVICCALWAVNTNAQSVWTLNFIDYPPAGDTTQISGIGYIEADYSSQAYYWMYLDTYIVDTTTGMNDFMRRDNLCCGAGYVWTNPMLPYDVTHDYITYMNPKVDPYFRREEDGALVDHYNYGYYLDQPVLWPSAGGTFGFEGSGPEIYVSFSIVLGTLNSLHSHGVTSKAPDHLKVITDRDRTRNDISCHPLNKEIDFLIVDRDNNPAGRINISEQPQPNAVDSCSGIHVLLNSCSDLGVGAFGNFTDSLKTGCPFSGTIPSDSCGFAFGNMWRWCVPHRGYEDICANLAWMFYDVHHSYVKVDNQLDMTDGTYKYGNPQ